MAVATPKRRSWSATEDAMLREYYGPMSAAVLGEMMGRSRGSVADRARKIGVKASTERGAALPGQPLAAAIDRWLVREAVKQTDVIAKATLSDWRIGRRPVSGPCADRWLCRLGLLWFDLWPDNEAARLYFEGPDEAVATTYQGEEINHA